jgi:DNA-binding MarR family transcriptional regulator
MLSQTVKLHHYNTHLMLRHQEVHQGQPPLLFALSREDGQTHSELADKLRITPATVTVMLKRMEKNGLLIRRPDPQDQRKSRVFLTEKGRATLEEVRQALKISENHCFEGFTAEEKQILQQYILRMQANLNRFEPPAR